VARTPYHACLGERQLRPVLSSPRRLCRGSLAADAPHARPFASPPAACSYARRAQSQHCGCLGCTARQTPHGSRPRAVREPTRQRRARARASSRRAVQHTCSSSDAVGLSQSPRRSCPTSPPAPQYMTWCVVLSDVTMWCPSNRDVIGYRCAACVGGDDGARATRVGAGGRAATAAEAGLGEGRTRARRQKEHAACAGFGQRRDVGRERRGMKRARPRLRTGRPAHDWACRTQRRGPMDARSRLLDRWT